MSFLEALHKTRLLTVEERPFKRITKRLIDPEKSLISKLPTLPPTPPPDTGAAEEEANERDEEQQKEVEKRRQWREDTLLDFAAFESSIIRIQFLLTSNAEEREGYARKKLKIEETAQAVRDNTADLRTQLAEAQRTLALRKEYDELAEKITSNRLLRPRDEQHVNLDKLNAEITELERESQEYAELWNRRRQQFDKIVDQTTEMQRQIKDEKEEVERREGMEEREENDEEQRDGGGVSGAATPRIDAGSATPMQGLEKGESTADASGALSVDHSKPVTRARTPLQESQLAASESQSQSHESPSQGKDDGEMAEDGEVSNNENDLEAAEGEGDNSEGAVDEENEGRGAGDRMDVT